MNKRFILAASAGICIVAAIVAATLAATDAQLFSVAVKHGPTLLLAQAQAPGRPLTTQEQAKPAPQTPVRDTVAPKAPPPPGTPNFPPRPANEPALKNPLNK